MSEKKTKKPKAAKEPKAEKAPAVEKPKSKRTPKQTRLPGTERTDVHKDIEKAAQEYVEARDERMSLTKREVETQAKLLISMKAHGLTRYRCDAEDLEVEIVPESEKAKVKKVPAPKPEYDGSDDAD